MDHEEDFDPRTELENLIQEAKDLKRSLECFIQYENTRAFDSKQKLISSVEFLSERLIRFKENYENH